MKAPERPQRGPRETVGAPLRIRVESTALHGKSGRVWINDEEVTGRVVAVSIDWRADNVNRAVIELLVDELTIDGLTFTKGRHGDVKGGADLHRYPLSPGR